MQSKLVAWAACATITLTAGSALADLDYQRDDGTPDGSASGGFHWGLKLYRVAGGQSRIRSVSAFIQADAVGDTALGQAGVWSDPNQDGHPDDAVLLGLGPPVDPDLVDGFYEFPLPHAIDVGSDGTSFFVGVYSPDFYSLIVGLDSSLADSGSWQETSTMAHGPDSAHAASWFNIGSLGTTFMIRAHATDTCPADLSPPPDGDGSVDTNDFFQFLAYYQAQDPRADFAPGGGVNTNDFFAFLAAYQAGC